MPKGVRVQISVGAPTTMLGRQINLRWRDHRKMDSEIETPLSTNLQMRVWRNGRRNRFRVGRSKEREGSTPFTRTNYNARMAERQTRSVEGAVPAMAWRFKSSFGHHYSICCQMMIMTITAAKATPKSRVPISVD